jgi:hypothetical protein
MAYYVAFAGCWRSRHDDQSHRQRSRGRCDRLGSGQVLSEHGCRARDAAPMPMSEACSTLSLQSRSVVKLCERFDVPVFRLSARRLAIRRRDLQTLLAKAQENHPMSLSASSLVAVAYPTAIELARHSRPATGCQPAACACVCDRLGDSQRDRQYDAGRAS